MDAFEGGLNELEPILQLASHKYLDAKSVLQVLELGEAGRLPLLENVEQRPESGALFLLDRARIKNFRNDGYDWIKKKSRAAVREDHVRLKINDEVRIYGCHAHSNEIKTFHRRSYWDLQRPESSMTVVHYLDTVIGSITHRMGCQCLRCVLTRLRLQAAEGSGGLPLKQEEHDIPPIPAVVDPNNTSNFLDPELGDFMTDLNFEFNDDVFDHKNLYVEDFAPERVEAQGGTKMMIILGSCLLRSHCRSISVGFGECMVRGECVGTHAITCRAPAMPYGTIVPLRVYVNEHVIGTKRPNKMNVFYTLYSSSEMGQIHHQIQLQQQLMEQQQQHLSRASTPNSIELNRVPGRLKRKFAKLQVVSSSRPSSAASVPDFDGIDLDDMDEQQLSEANEVLLERVIRILLDFTRKETLHGEIDALDEAGFNLLHITVYFSYQNLVSMLLSHGADPNARTSNGDTPLHLAAEQGDFEIALLLLKHKADPSILDGAGRTCIEVATVCGHLDFAHMFTIGTRFDSSSSSCSSSTSSSSNNHNNISTSSIDRGSKETKLLQSSIQTISLKDRCAMHIANETNDADEVGDDIILNDVDENSNILDVASPPIATTSTTSTVIGNANDKHIDEKTLGEEEVEEKGRTVKTILSQDGVKLNAALHAMHDDERSELEAEARVIQQNFRRWMLRRNMLNARSLEKDAKQFIHKTNSEDGVLEMKATKVQAVGKGFLARKEYRQRQQEVIQLQAAGRSLLAQKRFKTWRRQLSATLVIQRHFRAHQKKLQTPKAQ